MSFESTKIAILLLLVTLMMCVIFWGAKEKEQQEQQIKKHILASNNQQRCKADDPTRCLVLGGKLDINRASVSEWTLLPGIGERTAKLIVEHRTRLGGFASVDQLIEIQGIGKKTISRLKNWVQ